MEQTVMPARLVVMGQTEEIALGVAWYLAMVWDTFAHNVAIAAALTVAYDRGRTRDAVIVKVSAPVEPGWDVGWEESVTPNVRRRA